MVDTKIPILAKKHVATILLFLLEHNTVKKTDLVSIIHSNNSVDKLINELNTEGFISVKKEFAGRNTYYISLTATGRFVAEKVKEAQAAAEGKQEYPPNSHSISKQDFTEYTKHFKNFSHLSHLNVLDDHIAILEHNYDKKGSERAVFVYVRLNGNGIMRLWCEVDNSYSCWHVKYAWTLPDVQAMVQYQITRGNAKGVD